MVQRSTPSGMEIAYGVVEEVPGSDPDRAGKFRIRVYGYHDKFKKDDLPWVSPITYGTASYNNIGNSPWAGAYGPIVGTTVMVTALDPDKTMWVALGTTAASGKAPDDSTDREGPETPEKILGDNAPSDLPASAQTNNGEDWESNRWLKEFGGTAERQEDKDKKNSTMAAQANAPATITATATATTTTTTTVAATPAAITQTVTVDGIVGLGALGKLNYISNAEILLDAEIDFAKMAKITGNRLLGNPTDTVGHVQALTASQVKDILNIVASDIDGLGTLATRDTISNVHVSNTAGIALSKLEYIANSTLLGNISGASNPPTPLTAAQAKTLLNISYDDISGTIPGSGVSNNSITNAFLSDVPTATIKGRATAGTGDPEDLTATQVKTLLAITNSDVSGLGALATLSTVGTSQIDNDAVDNTKLANMGTSTIKGRSTAGTGDPEDLTAAQVKTLLAITNSDVSGLGSLATLSTISNTNVSVSAAISVSKINMTSGPRILGLSSSPGSFGAAPSELTPAQVQTILGLGNLAYANTANTALIDNDAVTNAKLANMATSTIKGRSTAGTGDPEDLTAAQTKTLLAINFTDISGTPSSTQVPTRLDEVSGSAVVADFNTCTLNGWYKGSSGSTTNMPTSASNQLVVVAYNASNIEQTAWNISSTAEADTVVYRRNYIGGSWTSWYRIYMTEPEIRNLAGRRVRKPWSYEYTAFPGGTTPSERGMTLSVSGTATARTPASGTATEVPRIGYVSNTATTTTAHVYGTVGVVSRGDASRRGGFYFNTRFFFSTITTGSLRGMVGLTADTWNGGQPSVVNDTIALMFNGAGTVWQARTVDGGGNTSTVSFTETSRQTNVPWDVSIWCDPNGSTIYYRIENMTNGSVETASITTDLPAANTMLTPIVGIGNAGTAEQVAIDISYIRLEALT